MAMVKKGGKSSPETTSSKAKSSTDHGYEETVLRPGSFTTLEASMDGDRMNLRRRPACGSQEPPICNDGANRRTRLTGLERPSELSDPCGLEASSAAPADPCLARSHASKEVARSHASKEPSIRTIRSPADPRIRRQVLATAPAEIPTAFSDRLKARVRDLEREKEKWQENSVQLKDSIWLMGQKEAKIQKLLERQQEFAEFKEKKNQEINDLEDQVSDKTDNVNALQKQARKAETQGLGHAQQMQELKTKMKGQMEELKTEMKASKKQAIKELREEMSALMTTADHEKALKKLKKQATKAEQLFEAKATKAEQLVEAASELGTRLKHKNKDLKAALKEQSTKHTSQKNESDVKWKFKVAGKDKIIGDLQGKLAQKKLALSSTKKKLAGVRTKFAEKTEWWSKKFSKLSKLKKLSAAQRQKRR